MGLVDRAQAGLFWQSRMGNNADGIGGNCHRYVVAAEETGGVGRGFLVDLGVKLGHNPAGYACELPSPKGLLARRDGGMVEGGGEPPEALILTHAHEDHLGGVRHVLDMGYVVPPVYATPFTAAMLTNSLVRAGIERERWPEIRLVRAGETIHVAGAEVEFVAMDHLPGATALSIRTGEATVFHTGDYKFDSTLPLGERADPQRLRAIGRQGVDMVVADSTSAATAATPVEEETICANLTRLVEANRGRAMLAGILGSQLDRLVSLGRAAKANNRSLAVVGSSLVTNVAAARAAGIDLEVAIGGPVLTAREARDLPAHKVLLVTTGAFAQPHAGLTRAADQLPGALAVDSDTTVIIPQRAIPSVTGPHARMVAKLEARGADVITAERALALGFGPIHQSGHAVDSDVRRLYSLLQPKMVVAPIHGDGAQVAANARLARALGIAALDLERNGAVVRVSHDGAEIVGYQDMRRIGARESRTEVKALPRSPRGQRRVPAVPAPLYHYDELDAAGRTVLESDVHPMLVPTRKVRANNPALIKFVDRRGR